MSQVMTPEKMLQQMIPLDYIRECIAHHIAQTGTTPVEISLDKTFMMFNGVRINFHDLGPMVLTFDGDKVVQHPSVEKYNEFMEPKDGHCGLCGEPMTGLDATFKYHGNNGPCPKPRKKWSRM